MEKKKTAPKAPAAKKPAKKAPAATEQAATPATAEQHSPHRKMLTGVVVSDKMQKTIVVKIERSVRHGLYKKYVTKSRRFKAHDENKDAKIGDLVKIVETRPMSRDKRWALHAVLRRAGQAGAVQVMKDIGE